MIAGSQMIGFLTILGTWSMLVPIPLRKETADFIFFIAGNGKADHVGAAADGGGSGGETGKA